MKPRLVVYGANGYTGRLIAQAAAQRGLAPVLAGRSREAVAALAAELRCESRAFDLSDPAGIARGLEGCGVVIHCAGPFSATAAPMMAAPGIAKLDNRGDRSRRHRMRAILSARGPGRLRLGRWTHSSATVRPSTFTPTRFRFTRRSD